MEEPGPGRVSTVFVDSAGQQLGEVARLFIPIYEGFLLDVDGQCVTVTAVEWEVTDVSTLCVLRVSPTPEELLDPVEPALRPIP